MAPNKALAAEATSLVARRLNTEAGATGELAASMGLVRLPLAGEVSVARAQQLRGHMLDARCDVPLHAQAYNEPADYEKLAEIVARVLREHG
jgi:isopenicillin-N epimerase